MDHWIGLYKKKELCLPKIRMLEEVGLVLSATKKTAGAKCEGIWNDMLAQYVDYVDENGTFPPSDNSKLGNWVRVQRKTYKKGTLKPRRVERLKAIGFVFDPRKELHDESEGEIDPIPASLPTAATNESILDKSIFDAPA